MSSVRPRPDSVPPSGKALQVRLRPASRIPPSAQRLFAVEEPLAGVAALYGFPGPDGFQLATRSLVDLDADPDGAMREVIALATLGRNFVLKDLVTPMSEGAPFYTNATFHPMIVASLLAPRMWRQIMSAFTPEPATLLAVAPAPSRIIWTTVDDAHAIALLRELAASSIGVEEDTLTTDVLRFENGRWTTLENPRAD